MSGLSAAAISATTRSKRSSIKNKTTETTERRHTSSAPPEQPRIKPTSYTTSRDLTGDRISLRQHQSVCPDMPTPRKPPHRLSPRQDHSGLLRFRDDLPRRVPSTCHGGPSFGIHILTSRVGRPRGKVTPRSLPAGTAAVLLLTRRTRVEPLDASAEGIRETEAPGYCSGNSLTGNTSLTSCMSALGQCGSQIRRHSALGMW